MRKLTNDEMKDIQLSILDDVAAFCNEKNIEYFLIAGTLLGAIRHKGYIPWDDDIDIAMRREYYEKFISIFPLEHPSLYLYRNNSEYENCPFFFTKVCKRDTIINEFYLDEKYTKGCGVNIDLFPVDDYVSYESAIKSIKKVELLKKIVTLKVAKRTFSTIRGSIKTIISMILSLIPMIYFNKVFNSILEKEVKSGVMLFSGIITGAYGSKEIQDKYIFDTLIDVEFENKKYKGLKEYDRYLTAVYGDYMKIPAKERQVTHHDFEGYLVDDIDSLKDNN